MRRVDMTLVGGTCGLYSGARHQLESVKCVRKSIVVLGCERGRVVDRGRRAVSSMRSDGGGKAVDGETTLSRWDLVGRRYRKRRVDMTLVGGTCGLYSGARHQLGSVRCVRKSIRPGNSPGWAYSTAVPRQPAWGGHRTVVGGAFGKVVGGTFGEVVGGASGEVVERLHRCTSSTPIGFPKRLYTLRSADYELRSNPRHRRMSAYLAVRRYHETVGYGLLRTEVRLEFGFGFGSGTRLTGRRTGLGTVKCVHCNSRGRRRNFEVGSKEGV